jgi:two-component system NarL family sensor kinase
MRVPALRPPWRRRRPAAETGAAAAARAAEPISVRREVLRFVAGGLVAGLAIGALSFFVIRRAAANEAINEAKAVTAIDADAIVTPELPPGAGPWDRLQVKAVDSVVRPRVLGSRVVRVKIWDEDGRIVYSDEPRLINEHYTLGADEKEALESGAADAEVSDLTKPENRFEQQYGSLVEVYQRIHAPDGTPLLFETYQLASVIDADASRVWGDVLPTIAGAMLLFFAVEVPLAWRLARRLERAGRDRSLLLQRAIDASDAERRRVASDLHDGPVQELTAMSLVLSAGEKRIASGDTVDRADAASVMQRAAAAARKASRDLRSLIVEIAPPDLADRGLVAAVERLLEPARHRGITVSVDAPEKVECTPEQAALLYRAAQEGVRNVLKHADATTVTIAIDQARDVIVLSVRDDGRGFDEAELRRRRDAGHVGLSMLEDRVREAGGTLSVSGHPGHGTEMRVELPV